MRLLIPFLLAMTTSSDKVRFETEPDFLSREVFLESIVKSLSDVSRPEECAKHCVELKTCSAFGYNSNSNVCQLLGDLMFQESSLITPWLEGQRYYFIRKDWCPLEQGFLIFRGTGLCLRWINSQNAWTEAAGICNNFGGRLAVLNSEEKRNAVILAVRNMGKENAYYSVGASDAVDEGTWVWSDGNPMPNWFYYGEPNGGNLENCLGVYRGAAHDVPCNDFPVKSICEITD